MTKISIKHTEAYFFGTLLLLLFQFLSYGQFSESEAEVLFEKFKHYNQSELEDDESELERLISFYDSIGEECKLTILYARKGLFVAWKNDEAEGTRHIIDALRRSEKNNCGKQTEAYIFWAYSSLYQRLNDQDKADSLAHLGVRMYKEDWEDKATLIGLYMNLADGYKPAKEVMPYLDTALALCRKHNKPFLESKVLISIGATYADDGQFDKAQDYFERSLIIESRRKNYRVRHALFNNLAGVIALQTEDFEPKVLTMMDSAVYYARLTDELIAVQDYTENMAYYYKMHDEADKAYDLLWQAHILKDTILDLAKYEAIAELEEKYEAEKRSNQIQTLTLENLNAEVENLRFKRTQNRLIIGSIILLFSVGFLAFNFLMLRRNRNLLAEKNKIISREKDRSEQLLLNILPSEIAEELKLKGKADARDFDEVTILFTDFKEFSKASRKMDAKSLVEEINICFEAFDKICEKYQVEKIKTIGDSYMAAGGLPVPRKDAVKNTVLAGIEMAEFIKKRKGHFEEDGELPFEMRVGINTGPVVAGIVGVKKFQYDIWGDTVNTASRMESNGAIEKVNISQDTYEILKNDNDFVFTSRGKVEAKGVGEVEMYFVELA